MSATVRKKKVKQLTYGRAGEVIVECPVALILGIRLSTCNVKISKKYVDFEVRGVP